MVAAAQAFLPGDLDDPGGRDLVDKISHLDDPGGRDLVDKISQNGGSASRHTK